MGLAYLHHDEGLTYQAGDFAKDYQVISFDLNGVQLHIVKTDLYLHQARMNSQNLIFNTTLLAPII